MNGRRQAITAALLCGLIPLVNMISPALVALVCLRYGLREALLVAAWAALPLIGWAMAGDLTPLILLIGVLALAEVLRASASWQYALLAAILVGVGAELALRIRPDFLVMLMTQVEAFLASGAGPQNAELTPEIMRGALISLFGVMHMFLAICLLILARWWQAVLYNPGGFQQEFHQFRLQPVAAMALMVLFVLASMGVTVLSGWVMYFVMPLFFAGLALVHGLIGLKKLSWAWLIAFYLLLLNPLLAQLLIVAALMDSWVDFRGRVRRADDQAS
jgi:hypothetical protein